MKQKIGNGCHLYPSLSTVVGANVKGKANFLAIAHVGIMNHALPEYLSVSLGKIHYTNAGIKENQTFSINIPSEGIVAQADYCGMVSGKKVDKSRIFEVFYGATGTAPMAKECPVNIECTLYQTVEFQTHDLFIGEVVETYVDEECLKGKVPDIAKVKPLLFDFGSRKYWHLGTPLADCWKVGKDFQSVNQ